MYATHPNSGKPRLSSAAVLRCLVWCCAAPDELRKEWEAFKAQQKRAKEEAAANHRGIYICRVDGRGWAHGDWAEVPQIRMVVVQNSLDMSLSDKDVALLQGQAALRGNQGSGSVVAGYKRVISANDELEANAGAFGERVCPWMCVCCVHACVCVVGVCGEGGLKLCVCPCMHACDQYIESKWVFGLSSPDIPASTPQHMHLGLWRQNHHRPGSDTAACLTQHSLGS